MLDSLILFNVMLYSKAQISPEQRSMMETLYKIAIKYIPMGELAMRGFAVMAAVAW